MVRGRAEAQVKAAAYRVPKSLSGRPDLGPTLIFNYATRIAGFFFRLGDGN